MTGPVTGGAQGSTLTNQAPVEEQKPVVAETSAAQPAAPTTGETAQATNDAAQAALNAKPAAQEEAKPAAQEEAKPAAQEEAKPAAQEEVKPAAQEEAAEESSEPSMVQRSLSTVGNFVNNVRNTTVEYATGVQNFVQNKTDEAVKFVSYDNLNQMGADAISFVAESTPVTKSQEYIDRGISFVGENAPASSNWLPVTVAAASVFASVKSIQAGVNNINLGNYKRAFCQIFVGASAAVLAGSIAYQTPAAQAVKDRVMGQGE